MPFLINVALSVLVEDVVLELLFAAEELAIDVRGAFVMLALALVGGVEVLLDRRSLRLGAPSEDGVTCRDCCCCCLPLPPPFLLLFFPFFPIVNLCILEIVTTS